MPNHCNCTAQTAVNHLEVPRIIGAAMSLPPFQCACGQTTLLSSGAQYLAGVENKAGIASPPPVPPADFKIDGKVAETNWLLWLPSPRTVRGCYIPAHGGNKIFLA
jgi:hypothetical protein